MTITFITGANKGLGNETARRLIELGQTVVIGACALSAPGGPAGTFADRDGDVPW
jgi:NAD(P)-dependent dehydrogenase (short-subunit alcohol dehydrogenase family)